MDGQRALFEHAQRNGVDIREGRLEYGHEGEYLNYIVATARPGAEWRKLRDVARGASGRPKFHSDAANDNDININNDAENGNGPTRIGVMLPGWGSGVSLYTYILPAIVDSFREIYCVDLPGMGLSSRPAFPSISDGPDASVAYFCAVLNSAFGNLFAQEVVVGEEPIGDDDDGAFGQGHSNVGRREGTKRVLIAHSMGAFISCRWLLQDTNNTFDSFVMISPAGIPVPPDQCEDADCGVDVHEDDVVKFAQKKKSDSNTGYTYSSRDIPAISGPLARVIDWCWRREITPQSILRIIPNSIAFFACRKYLQWRSPDLAENSQLLNYLYAVSRQNNASGETALCTLFYPGLWAKQPLINLVRNISIPTVFIYGDKDLMDSNDGIKAAAKMVHVKTSVKVLKNSSHCPFIDNVPGFSEELISALQKMNS